MKRLIAISIILFSLINANPIYDPSVHLSEIKVNNSNDWVIEFKVRSEGIGADSLKLECNDGFALITHLDTSDYSLISNANLKGSLILNSDGDVIVLHYYIWGQDYTETLRIGYIEDSYIKNIQQNESISRFPNSWSYYYYKDSSPTLGEINDYDGAKGKIYGHMYDYNGQPIANKYFFIDEGESGQILLDENGYYETELLSRSYSIITKKIYITSSNNEILTFNPVSYDLETGDSIEVDMTQLQTSITPVIQNTIKFNNYPHPASNYTWFVIDNIEIEASAMRVNVYALNGRKVDSFKPRSYQYRYDCSHLPQGSYIMSLQHGREVLATKKLQIMK
ncbi:MAG: T9SS type A sorting domain-containing protein [Candidatus Marinimicrobia bacterium]|nr:T9SS type A sorting domain-containing protein [Candidatus Neomarinimicrobiota bacterium]